MLVYSGMESNKNKPINEDEYKRALLALWVVFDAYLPDTIDKQTFTDEVTEKKFKKFYSKLESAVRKEMKKYTV